MLIISGANPHNLIIFVTSRNLQRHLNLCPSTLSIPKSTSRHLNHLFVFVKIFPEHNFANRALFLPTAHLKNSSACCLLLSEPWLLVIKCVQFFRGEHFLQDPHAQKGRAKNVQNGHKSAQKSANGRKSKTSFL